MATTGIVAGSSWVNLVAELSLAEDSAYLVQNVGNFPIALAEGGNSPSATAYFHVYDRLEAEEIIIGTEGWWIRCLDQTGSRVSVTLVSE